MTRDTILDGFLRAQHREGMALAAESDLLDLTALPGDPPCRYHARFGCLGLLREGAGTPVPTARHDVGIWFPDDYLRRAVPWEVMTWLAPITAFHPNISNHGPFICPGPIHPAMPLVDLLYQCYAIITFQKVTMREDDALNHAACVWARANQHQFPIDRRPLKWRRPVIQVLAPPHRGVER